MFRIVIGEKQDTSCRVAGYSKVVTRNKSQRYKFVQNNKEAVSESPDSLTFYLDLLVSEEPALYVLRLVSDSTVIKTNSNTLTFSTRHSAKKVRDTLLSTHGLETKVSKGPAQELLP